MKARTLEYMPFPKFNLYPHLHRRYEQLVILARTWTRLVYVQSTASDETVVTLSSNGHMSAATLTSKMLFVVA